VPGAVSSLRPTSAVLTAILVAAVSLWAGFAVVAGATRSSPGPAAPAQTRPEVAPPHLTLTAAPALRVRPALLERAPARATVLAARPAPAPAKSAHPSPAPATAMSAPASPPAAPEPSRTVQPSPSPRPAPKPQPTRTAAPSHPAGPDFDQSQPDGFDNSG
jgi:outer membrane biosynthesis protein TonB